MIDSTKRPYGLRLLLYFSCWAIPLTALCVVFIDAPLARTIEQLLYQNRFAWKHTRNIPNILPYFTAFSCVFMSLSYFIVRQHADRLSRFFLLTACSVPLAFLSKVLLREAFGRTGIRTWLTNGGPIDFNWFHPIGGVGGFPSGHATVFTAFFYAVWLYFPKLRPLAAFALLLLGAALVLANSHFLSDVLAGFYCGVLVTAGVQGVISKISSE